MRIHDAATGEERLAFYGLNSPVADVDISADGKLIAAITTDGYTKVWDRQLSSAAALLPQGAVAKEPVVVKPAEDQKPPSPQPAPPGPPAWLTALQQAGFTPKSVKQLPDGTWELDLTGAAISDLKLLSGAPISILKAGNTAITDLAPLRGMALKDFRCFNTKVTDLSPLQGMPLENLQVSGTPVTDLTPLRGMSLARLWLHDCPQLTDLTPLAEAKTLTTLTLPPNAKAIEFLRNFPKLERLGFRFDPKIFLPDKTAAEFWKEYGRQRKYEEALALSLKENGPEHPDTFTAMGNVADSYIAAGRKDEALKMREEVLALSRKVHGPEHPDTLTAMDRLARDLRALGRRDEALKLFEETLTLCLKVFGKEHGTTLGAMDHVGETYHDTGRKEDALKIREEVVALRRKVSGPEDPGTLYGMRCLADSYAAAGRKDEAEKLRQEAKALEGKK